MASGRAPLGRTSDSLLFDIEGRVHNRALLHILLEAEPQVLSHLAMLARLEPCQATLQILPGSDSGQVPINN